jgi:hypothetical protein
MRFVYIPKKWKRQVAASKSRQQKTVYFGDVDGYPPSCPDGVKAGKLVCVTTDCGKCSGNPTRRRHNNLVDKENCFY